MELLDQGQHGDFCSQPTSRFVVDRLRLVLSGMGWGRKKEIAATLSAQYSALCPFALSESVLALAWQQPLLSRFGGAGDPLCGALTPLSRAFVIRARYCLRHTVSAGLS